MADRPRCRPSTGPVLAVPSPGCRIGVVAERLLAKRLSLAQVTCPMRSVQQVTVPAGGMQLEASGPPLVLLRLERGRMRCAGIALGVGDSLLACAAGCRLECTASTRVSMLRLSLELAGAVDALAGIRLPVLLPSDREGLAAAAWDGLLVSRGRLRAGDVWMRVCGRAMVLSLVGLLLRSGCAAGTIEMSRTGLPEWLRAALELARRRLADPRLRISDLAAAAHLSPSHFTHRFSAGMGRSPQSWLVHERIRRACAMLSEQSEQGMKQVARACGFTDPGHFSRQFHRIAGCAPSSWSRLHPASPSDPLPGALEPP